jgi:hypothetical protein
MNLPIASVGASDNDAEAYLALDGGAGVRWTSRTPMTSTMTFWVELKEPAMISGIQATCRSWPGDEPRKWLVSVMDSTGGHGRKEVARGMGEVVAYWAPVRGFVVLIEQLGEDPEKWWSIGELAVDGEPIPDLPPVVPPVVPPGPVVLVCDPSQFGELAARQYVEAWATQFPEWGLYHEERRTPSGAVIRVTAHITYPLVRTRADGTTEPWPWAE